MGARVLRTNLPWMGSPPSNLPRGDSDGLTADSGMVC